MKTLADFHILVVDDYANNRFTLRALLQQVTGCVIHEADSGEKALSMTLEHPIDLILLDVQMPGMDGFETARHLQMTELTRQIPIIFITAVFRADAFIQHGYAIGAVDYLTKPIDDNLLLNRVRLYQTLHDRKAELQQTIFELQRAKTLLDQRHDLILKSAGEGIYGLDRFERITFINRAALAILGWSEKEVLGQSSHSLFHSHYPDGSSYHREQCPVYKTLQGQTEITVIEDHFIHRDGHHFPVLLTCTPIVEDKTVTGIVVVFRDLTSQKQNESALCAAKEAAEAANKAKSVFLANISHELRTPLNAILGFAQILHRDAHLSAEQQQAVTTIERSGKHLLVLINDILDLAKIEAGRFHLQPDHCLLSVFFANLCDVFALQAEQKGLKFIYQPVNLPKMVKVDEKRLRQVMINLLGNAVKFTEQGQITLDAHYDRDSLTVRVIDTGIGMSKSQIATLFQPFQQGVNNPYQQQGTGLGLAISQNLVQQMGGAIQVDCTTESQGCCFSFALNLPEVKTKKSARNTCSAINNIVGYQRLDGKKQPLRLLLVDDQKNDRAVLAGLLQPLGFELREAINAQQALAEAVQWHPDLIFMDRIMPEMDGLEATQQILRQPGLETMPIIAVSACALAQDCDESLAAGCRSHLTKPLNGGELCNQIQQTLPLKWVHQTEQIRSSTEPLTLETHCYQQLPLELLDTLEQAVIRGQPENLQQVLKSVQNYDKKLAQMLEECAAIYAYDQLLRWIKKAKKS